MLDDGKRGYNGTLGVPGANEDSERIAEMILENINKFDEIYVTLDTHMSYHIAHPSFWKDAKGNSPKPLTHISVKDVKCKLSTLHPHLLIRITQLEIGNRSTQTSKNGHCITYSN